MPTKNETAEKRPSAARRNAVTTKHPSPRVAADRPGPAVGPQPAEGDEYVLPLVHTRVPAGAVNAGFWGGLAVAALVGLVELPVAVLVGAAVAVARHRDRGTSPPSSPSVEVEPR